MGCVSSHRLEPLYALGDRRMGVEEVVKERRSVLQRVRDVQGGRGLVRDLKWLLVGGDLAKRGRKPRRIPRKQRTGSVREVLALPGDGELDERRDDRLEHVKRDRDDRDDV